MRDMSYFLKLKSESSFRINSQMAYRLWINVVTMPTRISCKAVCLINHRCLHTDILYIQLLKICKWVWYNCVSSVYIMQCYEICHSSMTDYSLIHDYLILFLAIHMYSLFLRINIFVILMHCLQCFFLFSDSRMNEKYKELPSIYFHILSGMAFQFLCQQRILI